MVHTVGNPLYLRLVIELFPQYTTFTVNREASRFRVDQQKVIKAVFKGIEGKMPDYRYVWCTIETTLIRGNKER